MAVRKIETEISLLGEKEFNDQMKAVNSNLKTLKSEMALTSSEFKGQANSAEALRAKQKVLSEQYEQQAEKVKALEKMLEKAKSAYGENSSQVDSYRQQLNNAKTTLNRFGDELDDTNKYLKEAEDSADGAATSIDKFGREVKDAGDKTSTFATIVKANLASDVIKGGVQKLAGGLKALPVAVVRELADGLRTAVTAVKEMADSAGDIDDAAKRVGTTAEEYQKWAYAAKLGGMEVSTLESLMVKQQKSFSDAKEGTKATAEAYKRLGIDINEVAGADGAFEQVINALADMEDETTRNALANDIFGKTYADLAPLLAEGSDGIAAWRQEVVDLGGVMSNEAVEAGASFGDALDRLQTRFDGLKNNLSGEFLPAFTDIVNGATELLGGNVDKGIDLIETGLDKASEVLDRLGPAAEAALDGFIDAFIKDFPKVVETGGNLILKLIDGIGDKGPDIIRAATDAINILVDKLIDPSTLKILWQAGANIGEALIDGIFDILSNLATRAWGEIKSAFASNPYTASTVSKGVTGTRTRGGTTRQSYAGGLSYVPFDGYLAELHRGERVLTAGQAAVSESGTEGAQVVELHTTIELDRNKVGEAVTKYQIGRERAGRA